MAEATAVSGKLDTPITAGIIVLAALGALFALHKIVITVK